MPVTPQKEAGCRIERFFHAHALQKRERHAPPPALAHELRQPDGDQAGIGRPAYDIREEGGRAPRVRVLLVEHDHRRQSEIRVSAQKKAQLARLLRRDRGVENDRVDEAVLDLVEREGRAQNRVQLDLGVT